MPGRIPTGKHFLFSCTNRNPALNNILVQRQIVLLLLNFRVLESWREGAAPRRTIRDEAEGPGGGGRFPRGLHLLRRLRLRALRRTAAPEVQGVQPSRGQNPHGLF